MKDCFQAAAVATGCKVTIEETGKVFDNLMSNRILAKLYGENLQAFGLNFHTALEEIGSTDMGNVSYIVPSIHPMYLVGNGEVYYHSREFTTVTDTPEAHSATLTAAKAMAHTCIDVLTTEGLLEEIQVEFQQGLQGSQ